jgi:hypothetical protein
MRASCRLMTGRGLGARGPAHSASSSAKFNTLHKLLNTTPKVVGYALACPPADRSSPCAASPHNGHGKLKHIF